MISNDKTPIIKTILLISFPLVGPESIRDEKPEGLSALADPPVAGQISRNDRD